jgi:hypothetical protein
MFYFGNMDGGNSKCGDGDSMAIITSAAFGSSVALAEATWARSSGVHKGLPSDQLPRHLSYHWADESKRSKSFAESKPSAFSHFRSASLSVSHSLSLSLGPNLGPTFLSKRILPKIASSKINLWVFHGFSMFCSGRILTHPFLNQDLQGPWHEDFGSSAVARDHHLHREHQAPWLLKSPSAEIMWP